MVAIQTKDIFLKKIKSKLIWENVCINYDMVNIYQGKVLNLGKVVLQRQNSSVFQSWIEHHQLYINLV